MTRPTLLVLLLALAVACTPSLPLVAGPAQDPSKWPPAADTLNRAVAAMGGLKTLREQFTTRTVRDDQLFMEVHVERAYVAPDRRYEKIDGRSAVEAAKGETVYIGSRFFKRVGEGPWEDLPGMESFIWPANEYTFAGVRNVAYEGPGDVEGRPARIIRFGHEGTVETKNAGWQFETRLWIEPETGYFLRRETRGTREEIDMIARRTIVWRHEGTWRYSTHNGSIGISEPPVAPAGQ